MQESENLILHVDVDAFFASVEQLLIPALRKRPVVVGSGCIASCSYEARRFGLHAGMPLQRARRLCPAAVILPGQYQVYRCFAEHIWQICRQYTCGLETYLDEAYGDASGIAGRCGGPAALGRRLRQHVRRQLGLPLSVGLAGNRMLAKIASSSAKPNGVVWIRPGREEAFLVSLPVEKLLGVGPKTARRLHDMNIRTAGELRRLSRELLRDVFGLRGEALYEQCRGRDPGRRAIRPAAMPRSISRETTFHQPTCRPGEIRGMLQYLLERAMRTVRRRRLLTRCVELSIRYDDFREQAAQRALPHPTAVDDEVLAVVGRLLDRLYRRRVSLRHVGVVLSDFSPAGAEATLFEPPARSRRRSLYAAIDSIRDRWGHAAVVTGRSIELLGHMQQNDYGFVLRTPALTK